LLINNAGISGGHPPYTALSASSEQLIEAFNTNVIGLARVTGVFIDLLKKSLQPRIVNVSTSVGSLSLQSNPEGPPYSYAKYAVYDSSKAALNMYTIQLAYELLDTQLKLMPFVRVTQKRTLLEITEAMLKLQEAVLQNML
jgi:NAD(P)-dependent dehydrogenase (short-subunit alcohol dehydrogenase family)